MLLLAHTGITWGIFNLLYRVLSKISLHRKKGKEFIFPARLAPHPANPGPPATSKNWHIDYRFVLLGSLFPDIVDKPLGMIIFANLFANGRIYTHTLLINLILVGAGIYFVKRKRYNFLLFALASCSHLVLDKMWLNLHTLLWPFYGWGFPKGDISQWWERMFYGLLANPWVYVPEIIGAVILGIFGTILVKRGLVGKFLRQGAPL